MGRGYCTCECDCDDDLSDYVEKVRVGKVLRIMEELRLACDVHSLGEYDAMLDQMRLLVGRTETSADAAYRALNAEKMAAKRRRDIEFMDAQKTATLAAVLGIPYSHPALMDAHP